MIFASDVRRECIWIRSVTDLRAAETKLQAGQQDKSPTQGSVPSALATCSPSLRSPAYRVTSSKWRRLPPFCSTLREAHKGKNCHISFYVTLFRSLGKVSAVNQSTGLWETKAACNSQSCCLGWGTSHPFNFSTRKHFVNGMLSPHNAAEALFGTAA